jgi:hypothetical protein
MEIPATLQQLVDNLCQCQHKTPAILPALPIRARVNLGGDPAVWMWSVWIRLSKKPRMSTAANLATIRCSDGWASRKGGKVWTRFQGEPLNS